MPKKRTNVENIGRNCGWKKFRHLKSSLKTAAKVFEGARRDIRFSLALLKPGFRTNQFSYENICLFLKSIGATHMIRKRLVCPFCFRTMPSATLQSLHRTSSRKSVLASAGSITNRIAQCKTILFWAQSGLKGAHSKHDVRSAVSYPQNNAQSNNAKKVFCKGSFEDSDEVSSIWARYV